MRAVTMFDPERKRSIRDKARKILWVGPGRSVT